MASVSNGCVAECDSKFDYLDINRRCRNESGYWWRYCWLLWAWLWWYDDDNDNDDASIDQVSIDSTSRRGTLFNPTHLLFSKAEQDSLMTRKSISNPIYRTHLIGGIGKRNEKSHVHLYFGIPAKNIAKLVTAVQFHLFSSARKILIPCIQAYMPYESSEDSSKQPNSPVESTRWRPDPLGPAGPP